MGLVPAAMDLWWSFNQRHFHLWANLFHLSQTAVLSVLSSVSNLTYLWFTAVHKTAYGTHTYLYLYSHYMTDTICIILLQWCWGHQEQQAEIPLACQTSGRSQRTAGNPPVPLSVCSHTNYLFSFPIVAQEWLFPLFFQVTPGIVSC